MKGRAPKSEAAKQLQGNPGKRRSSANPAGDFFSPPPDAGPWAAPAWLSDGAKVIWSREVDAARDQARLQTSQIPLLALYCDALCRLETYSKQIEAEGATYTTPSGYRRVSPEVGLRDRAATEVKDLSEKLMLNPKAWATGMGTYQSRQLDLFRQDTQPPRAKTAAPEAPAHDIDSYVGNRPTIN